MSDEKRGVREVLVVEDEAIPALELRLRIDGWGLQVVRVEITGESGVRAAVSERPDLIIMDVILPGMLDGIAAAERIHEIVPIPIVFMTAASDAVRNLTAVDASLHRVVSKPYRPTELREAIEELLGPVGEWGATHE